MSLFSSLGTAYSGLQVAQVSTDVISSNIANAENEDYTRQRVDLASKMPVSLGVGRVGTGAEVAQIIRVHDEFVYERYRNASGNLEFSNYQNQVMVEISQYFPDVDQVGLLNDLSNFFDSWQKLSNNPADASQKIVLANATQVLGQSIEDVRDRLTTMQDLIDEELVADVAEINRIGERIAEINSEIRIIEAQKYDHANTLRDERDALELALAKLINPNVSKTGVKAFSEIDTNVADYNERYSIQVGGYPFVEDDSFHPLEVSSAQNSSGGLNAIYYKFKDQSLVDISDSIRGGEVGAMLNLRGRNFNFETGEADDGLIQEYKDQLDTFTRGLIQGVNTVYAASSDKSMLSDTIGDIVALTGPQADEALLDLYPDVMVGEPQSGTMVIRAYDISGNPLEDLTVNIDIKKDTMRTLVAKINTELQAKGLNAVADFSQGTLNINPGDDGDPGTDVGAVLIKEDNSLVVDALSMTPHKSLEKVDAADIPFEISNGTFDINIYDDAGIVTATRTITIDKDSGDPLTSTLAGVIAQINMSHMDDNGDNDFTNDVDDVIQAHFSDNRLIITTKDKELGTFFNIEDNGTGFAGAVGLHKFLDGDSAANMNLARQYRDDAAAINAYAEPVEGDNKIANAMQQLQYDDIPFYEKDGDKKEESIIGYYKILAGNVAEDTHSIQLTQESNEAIYTTIQEQHYSISAVSIDEELANLIKFQTGYSASAKVITTVQQMLDALLSLKQ